MYELEQRKLVQDLYFKSPKGYKLLRQKCDNALPHPASIRNWRTFKYVSTGSNELLRQALIKKVSEMSEKERYSALVFDEMSITPKLQYNGPLDSIIGISI